jgi:hypothetical protein
MILKCDAVSEGWMDGTGLFRVSGGIVGEICRLEL